MQQHDDATSGPVVGGVGRNPYAGGHRAAQSEVLCIRNYDHQRAYDLRIEAFRDENELVFQRRYYLQPGLVESETDALPSGEYEIRVTLDNSHRETLRCRIDSAPEHTAVVEVGNGVLSLTQGLPR